MTTKYSALLTLAVLALTACVDTTGLSADSTKPINPKSNPNAVVSVVEYGDLQCPACKGAYTLVVAPLLQKYGSQIRFEFRQFPLSSIHQYAMEAAEASECAADQGKFWEFVDTDYTHQEDLNSNALTQWGKDIGLDADLFDRCRRSHIKRSTILAEYDAGQKLGVNGTPTFFVNGVIVSSTADALGKAIEEAIGNPGIKL